MEMNEGRSHGGILGVRGRGSQTKLGCLVLTIDVSGPALTPRGYVLAGVYMGCTFNLSKYQYL